MLRLSLAAHEGLEAAADADEDETGWLERIGEVIYIYEGLEAATDADEDETGWLERIGEVRI